MSQLQPMFVKWQDKEAAATFQNLLFIDFYQERVFYPDGTELEGPLLNLILDIIKEKKDKVQISPISEDMIKKIMATNTVAQTKNRIIPDA